MQPDLVNGQQPKAKRVKSSVGARHPPTSLRSLPTSLASVTLSFLSIEEHLICLSAVSRYFRTLLTSTTAWPPKLSFSGKPAEVSEHLHKFALLRFVSADLQGLNITDKAPTHLVKMPLSTLYLDSCLDVTDTGLQFAGSNGITNAGLANLVGLPLTHLSLKFCCKITSEGFAHLARLPLKRLLLDFCDCTDAGLAHLAALPLEQLSLMQARNITDNGLAYLPALPLQYLNLSGCKRITNAGLAHLADLPLRVLALNFCSQITDEGLAHLANLPLQELGLYQCINITDAGLAHLVALPIKELDLRKCNKTSTEGINRTLNRGHHCVYRRFLTLLDSPLGTQWTTYTRGHSLHPLDGCPGFGYIRLG
jgi:hypothetical protein